MKSSLKVKMILQIVPAVCMVLVVFAAIFLYTATIAQEHSSRDVALELAHHYADQLDSEMSTDLSMARTLAATMEVYTANNRQEVNYMLYNILVTYPNAVGAYVGYEPNAFDGRDALYANTPGSDATGRFVPYWNRLQGYARLEAMVDMDTSDWYNIPKQTKSDQVIEPLLYNGVLMTSIISPIMKDGQFRGISGMDVSLSNLDTIVRQIRLYDTGYAFLVSNKGVFVSYPDKDFIGARKLQDYGRDTGNPALEQMASDIEKGLEGSIVITDPLTGKESIMYYSPVKTGKWGMVIVAPVDEAFQSVYQLRRMLLIASVFSLILMIAVVIAVSSSLAKPIINMSNTANIMAAGNLNIHVDEQPGELGILADAFNNMSARLGDLFRRLEQKVNELDQARLHQEELIQELEARNAELERFNYTVSHDLRNPLITIKGFAGYLKKDILDGDSNRFDADLERINKAADKMQNLLEDLLEISRIGRIINPPEKIDMQESANEAIDRIKEKNHLSGIEIVIDENMPWAYGDRPRIREIWDNLVDNAVKFRGDQGNLLIEIGCTSDAAQSVYFVRDNGMGIEAAYHRKIFGVFEQLDNNSDGSGMGLAIVKRIVEFHGGRVWVESDGKGCGSTFYFTLANKVDEESKGDDS